LLCGECFIVVDQLDSTISSKDLRISELISYKTGLEGRFNVAISERDKYKKDNIKLKHSRNRWIGASVGGFLIAIIEAAIIFRSN
jgi:hypothetical protein